MKQAGAWVLAFTCVATAEAGIVLEARIQDLDGKGASGFVVKAVREETRVSRTAVTDSSGTAIVRLSGNGVYSVTVWKPDYAASEVRIDVASGERRVMRFSADPQRRVVHLESESRDLRRKGGLPVGVALGVGVGDYEPRLITLNSALNPLLRLGPQRTAAMFRGEISIQLGSYTAVGVAFTPWESEAFTFSTFTLVVRSGGRSIDLQLLPIYSQSSGSRCLN